MMKLSGQIHPNDIGLFQKTNIVEKIIYRARMSLTSGSFYYVREKEGL
jgi:hypothetical protein